MGRAIGIANAIGFRVGSKVNLLQPPTNLVSSFNVDTISGELEWTDNSGGTAEYEVYSSFNGGSETLIATTAAGATSYADATCKQNASVVYRIRAKKGAATTDFIQAAALATPLCFKTDQSVLATLTINALYILAGKSVAVNWGDGISQTYSGGNPNITKNYLATGQYNVSISGDTDSIYAFNAVVQNHVYGDLSNWVIPSQSTDIRFNQTLVSGNLQDWVIPATLTLLRLYVTECSGYVPKLAPATSGALNYSANSCYFNASNIESFKQGMTIFDISSQKVVFSTSEIDKLLLNLASYYEVNAPTASCTINMSGANMGIPTGGSSNADLTRLVGYYTAAGFTATVIVRTS